MFARAAVIALVAIVGLAAAQSCPITAAQLYVTSCPETMACAVGLCTCVGAATPASGDGVYANGTCTVVGATCDQHRACAADYIACVNYEASNGAACLASLKVSLVSFAASGSTYNGSALDSSCRAAVCATFSQSSLGTTCNAGSYATACVAPVITTGVPIPAGQEKMKASLTIGGVFTTILADTTKTASLAAALKKDLEAKLGYTTTVDTMVDGSLIAGLTIDAPANNAGALAAVTAAAASSTWLTRLQAAYTAAGGVGTLSVLGFRQIAPRPVTASAPTVAVVAATAVALLAALVA